jgi:hypothetical protein
VASLFFNVPARRKFLKSPAKDTADIIKAVTCLALTAPQTSFRLIIDGHSLFSVQGGTRLPDRARTLLKDPFTQDGIELVHSQEGISIEGLIVDPKNLRSNRSGQYLIVNGRTVSSLPISYAVKAAYGTTCDDRHHPLFALNITLDPASIDVNVHPQKKEIRFADEEWVRVVLQEAVSKALFGKKAVHSWKPFVPNGPVVSRYLLGTHLRLKRPRFSTVFRKFLAARSVLLWSTTWLSSNRIPIFLAESLAALFWRWTYAKPFGPLSGTSFLWKAHRNLCSFQYLSNAPLTRLPFFLPLFQLLSPLGWQYGPLAQQVFSQKPFQRILTISMLLNLSLKLFMRVLLRRMKTF